MTDLYSDYRRKSGREDPRLARRDSKGSSSSDRPKQQYDKLGIPISPKEKQTSPSKDAHNWSLHQAHNQTNQYNSSLQTTYQHLPSALYTDHGQYSTHGYSTAYPTYQQQGYATQAATYDPYQAYGQQAAYGTVGPEPGPPGEEYPQNEWAPVSAYSNMAQAPSHDMPVAQQVPPAGDSKKEAVAQELKQQKVQMSKQREEYVRKVSVLRRELDLLRNQKQELLEEHSSEHDNKHILRENNKLQIEIQNKMKAINNVIEMLTNIIGDRLTISELEEQCKEDSPKHRREKSRRSAPAEKVEIEPPRYCYVYYDPELHWCRVCDVFPKSAKDYLLHLHSKEHRQITQERDMVDTPWHRLPAEPELPSFEGATKKRMPIKGLQFLISATSWYCKLCDTWVGDLHCASQHLKSQNHNQNFANFVEQNPHWEIEWLRDRDKALVRISKDRRSDSDDSDNHEEWKKTKKESFTSTESKKDKKKKKLKKRKKHSSDSSSTSSSSDSSSENESNDKSKSIRVAMRNKMKLQAQMIMSEDVGDKWEALGRLVEESKRKEPVEVVPKVVEPEDSLISQWMTINEPQEKDKRLFNNLKDRMKQKQEAEKARLAELEQQRLEKEKQERELQEKKEQEERALREKEEEKRRQQEELEKQREREREQIRFKTKEKPKKRSASKSPEKPAKYSRSPSSERHKRERSAERRRHDNHHNENGRHSSDGRRKSPSYDKARDRERSHRDKRTSTSSNKKPHFIGRMPLFKNKKVEEKHNEKEIKKEEYDIPRRSRFQPGNLARAFIPEPEVVCFPRLSSIPPLAIPPPPSLVPDAPKISEEVMHPPPPPIINNSLGNEKDQNSLPEGGILPAPPPPPTVCIPDYDSDGDYTKGKALSPSDYEDPISQLYPEAAAMMQQYQYANMEYNAMMYSQMYDYSQDVAVEAPPAPPADDIPLEHTLPLPPPPLPPDDPNEDLAMLGMSADDMAAQSFKC
ncbi:zinc finger matrin-type protein CG9776-like isoform X1 [Photinus pyralis]|nr:zinc finger matrin-type protein CG9776-like isoform X1 [Photinus pyralis]XP_031339062.1 zinc finger matrin-type protein CG9776-like isoform X1 [Photinus pyralis]XP_031339063.1 zinc finger matrin-type protein CG9776-like isoform X1 [Photinus pyralis]